MKELKAPQTVFDEIDKYRKLQLGNKEVVCPYYINLKRAKDLRAMVGKGTVDEIVQEAKIWEKLKGVNFNEMSESEIREFLMNRGIGIDCSGFILQVLNAYYKSKTGKNIWKKFKPFNRSFMGRIGFLLKPVEKLGAEIMSNEENAVPVKTKDVKPLDVIRMKWKKKNSHHILLIVGVEKNDKDEVTKIEYAHSIPKFGDKSGVKFGEIEITDQEKDLKDQNWLEEDENGVKHTYEGYMIQVEDNGIRRLGALRNY